MWVVGLELIFLNCTQAIEMHMFYICVYDTEWLLSKLALVYPYSRAVAILIRAWVNSLCHSTIVLTAFRRPCWMFNISCTRSFSGFSLILVRFLGGSCEAA